LASCGSWLTSHHGVLTIAQIVIGSLEEHADRRAGYLRTLRKFIARQGLQAFPTIVVASDLSQGIESLVQCHGIGGMQANTVLMGWPNDEGTSEVFGANLRLITRMKKSVICMRFLDFRGEVKSPGESTINLRLWGDVPEGTIDVWWRGKSNGELMMILGHLLQKNPLWDNNPIRVLRVVANESGREEVKNHILELAALARISVEPVVLVSKDISATIQKASADAGIVIFGFQVPEKGGETAFFLRMESVVGDLRKVLLVNSAGGVELIS
jgi:hypothetical protein